MAAAPMAAPQQARPHARVLGNLMKTAFAKGDGGVVSVAPTAPVAVASAGAPTPAPPHQAKQTAPLAKPAEATPGTAKPVPTALPKGAPVAASVAPTAPSPAPGAPAQPKLGAKLTAGLLGARRPTAPAVPAPKQAPAPAPQKQAPAPTQDDADFEEPNKEAPVAAPAAKKKPAQVAAEEAESLASSSDSDAESGSESEEAPEASATQKTTTMKKKTATNNTKSTANVAAPAPKKRKAPAAAAPAAKPHEEHAEEEDEAEDGGAAPTASSSSRGKASSVTKRDASPPTAELTQWFMSREFPDSTGIDDMLRIERARPKEPWMDLTARGLVCVHRIDGSPDAIARREACYLQAELDAKNKCKGVPPDDYVPNRYHKFISNCNDVAIWYHPTLHYIVVCSDYGVQSYLETNPHVAQENPDAVNDVGFVLGRAALRQLYDVPAPAQVAKQGNRRIPTNTQFDAESLNPSPQSTAPRFVPDLLIYDQQKGAPAQAGASSATPAPVAAPTPAPAVAAAAPQPPSVQATPSKKRSAPQPEAEAAPAQTPTRPAKQAAVRQEPVVHQPPQVVQQNHVSAQDHAMHDVARQPLDSSLVEGIGIPQVLSALSRASQELGLASQQASYLLSSSRIERGSYDALFNAVLNEQKATSARLTAMETGIEKLAKGITELTSELRKLSS